MILRCGVSCLFRLNRDDDFSSIPLQKLKVATRNNKWHIQWQCVAASTPGSSRHPRSSHHCSNFSCPSTRDSFHTVRRTEPCGRHSSHLQHRDLNIVHVYCRISIMFSLFALCLSLIVYLINYESITFSSKQSSNSIKVMTSSSQNQVG